MGKLGMGVVGMGLLSSLAIAVTICLFSLVVVLVISVFIDRVLCTFKNIPFTFFLIRCLGTGSIESY